MGPVRGKDQIEISRTDEFYLGVDAPIRASGDVDNTPGITLVGSEDRKLDLPCGVICAWRHIHMTPEDAEAFGVEDRDVVEVEVGKDGVRSLTFGDVLVRVKSSYRLEMHIDTDEGNAAELARQDVGRLEAGETLQQVGAATEVDQDECQRALISLRPYPLSIQPVFRPLDPFRFIPFPLPDRPVGSFRRALPNTSPSCSLATAPTPQAAALTHPSIRRRHSPG